MAGSVVTVRFNLEGARRHLRESVSLVRTGRLEDAYKLALRARNGVFHARRAWCDLTARTAPQMPVTGAAGGRIEGHEQAAHALDAATAAGAEAGEDAAIELGSRLDEAEKGLVQYLGYLRDEVAKRMRPGG